MGLMDMGLFLLLFCSAYSYQLETEFRDYLFADDPDAEWLRMETEAGEENMPVLMPRAKFSPLDSGSSKTQTKTLPEYLVVSTSKDQKEVFKPGKGTGHLSDWAKAVLLGRPPSILNIGRVRDPTGLVEVLCHVDRIYVRIKKGVFKTIDAYKYLKLGTCPVNQSTKTHYYLLYLLRTDCGFKREVDQLTISNVLHYKPTTPVLREMPFEIPLKCIFPRTFYSYEVGFYPLLQGGTIFKAMPFGISLALTLQDASGNKLRSDAYVLGQTMYFEAKQSGYTASSGDWRLYINKCFMTRSRDPKSNPKYPVIDNKGCMIDGMMTKQSKFLTGSSKMAQRFSVSAFFFKDASSASSQKLYMHCEAFIGKLTPTQSSKACNYDPATKKWKELYSDDPVCTCCSSTCPSAQPRGKFSLNTTV
uniref:Zona pellucida glycoprotein 3c n=1 Tax=Mastacembelus armatus TaxID=205130 RepID=A0A3Q3LIK0_9TELE